uniref:Peptidase C14 caspase domain-containing protein n=1 Tax=Chromera velia CCMP2878 TaxID=1169474 RepID=A0A0G4I6R5_9ALVE|eukprot:Cvel_11481.t1-p1 / transcript=Cvel_11481.t1 / gene=Cvel_11481 / organism=Chromera_velia_CCMP2878 / gene_product=Metacaspase-1, putative / transcript_product=Metacaspase-1, putative / location=Cvel_scaffold723:13796-21195(-) / protein_length=661 / sequence_SO=supercontig / SO=protein_coding / is_pseudo=false
MDGWMDGWMDAVVVGCDYPGTVAELRGCVNDAYGVARVLTLKFGFTKDFVVFLVDRDRSTQEPVEHSTGRAPTKSRLIKALKWLTLDSGPGDVLFFSFSGIGSMTYEQEGLRGGGGGRGFRGRGRGGRSGLSKHTNHAPGDAADAEAGPSASTSSQAAAGLHHPHYPAASGGTGTSGGGALTDCLCPADFAFPDSDGFPYTLLFSQEIQGLLAQVHPEAQLVCLFDCNHAASLLPASHRLSPWGDGGGLRLNQNQPPSLEVCRSRNVSAWACNEIPCRPRFLPPLPIAKRTICRPLYRVPEGSAFFALLAASEEQNCLEACLGGGQPSEMQGLLSWSFVQACENMAEEGCSVEALFSSVVAFIRLLKTDMGARGIDQWPQLLFPAGVNPSQHTFLFPSRPPLPLGQQGRGEGRTASSGKGKVEPAERHRSRQRSLALSRSVSCFPPRYFAHPPAHVYPGFFAVQAQGAGPAAGVLGAQTERALTLSGGKGRGLSRTATSYQALPGSHTRVVLPSEQRRRESFAAPLPSQIHPGSHWSLPVPSHVQTQIATPSANPQVLPYTQRYVTSPALAPQIVHTHHSLLGLPVAPSPQIVPPLPSQFHPMAALSVAHPGTALLPNTHQTPGPSLAYALYPSQQVQTQPQVPTVRLHSAVQEKTETLIV